MGKTLMLILVLMSTVVRVAIRFYTNNVQCGHRGKST